VIQPCAHWLKSAHVRALRAFDGSAHPNWANWLHARASRAFDGARASRSIRLASCDPTEPTCPDQVDHLLVHPTSRDSAIFRCRFVSHFSAMNATILLYWTQPFLLYCSVILWICYSELSHLAQSFCYLVIHFCNTELSHFLLQCSVILWFCYGELSHFVIMSSILLHRTRPFFATVLRSAIFVQYSVIFIILWAILLQWTQPFSTMLSYFCNSAILLQC
jgi:hypothetical protein